MVLERMAGEGRRELSAAIKVALAQCAQARKQAVKLTVRGMEGQ
jgi:hypothetical protein